MGDYNFLERILHRLILSTDAVSELLFTLEKMVVGDAPPCRDAVYVTGLARAGTTALLQSLHATREFSCSTYADMY